MQPVVIDSAKADAVGGFSQPPPAKRACPSEGDSSESLAAQLEAMRLRAESAESRLEVVEARSSPGPTLKTVGVTDGPRRAAELVFAAGDKESEPKMNLVSMKQPAKLPRMAKSASTFQLVVLFFASCPVYLTKALFKPVPRYAAKACEMAKRMVKATVSDTVTYADTNPFLSTLYFFTALCIVTNWRPYADGLVTAENAESIVPTAGLIAQLTLPCLASYMKKKVRLSFTGAHIGASIIESTHVEGTPLPNALAFDTRPVYRIKSDDTKRGTKSNAPAAELNADLWSEWDHFYWMFVFFHFEVMMAVAQPTSLVVFVHSDMVACGLFAWFAAMAADHGVYFSALRLAPSVLQFITGFYPTLWEHSSTQAVWLVLVPAYNGCPAHVKVLVFAYSQCYLNDRSQKSGLSISHHQCQIVRGLANLATRAWLYTTPLWLIADSAGAAQMTSVFRVLFRTAAQAGGDWSPTEHILARGYALAAVQALVKRIADVADATARDALLMSTEVPKNIRNEVAKLVGSVRGGRNSGSICGPSKARPARPVCTNCRSGLAVQAKLNGRCPECPAPTK